MQNDPNISPELFHGIQGDDSEKIKRLAVLTANVDGLKIFLGLLEHRLETLNREVYSKKNYDSPSWPFIQADLNGQIRQLTELSRLLSFTK